LKFGPPETPSHKQSIAVHDTDIRNGDDPEPVGAEPFLYLDAQVLVPLLHTASESEETGRDSSNSVQARKVTGLYLEVCEGDGDCADGRRPLHRAAPNPVDRTAVSLIGGLVPCGASLSPVMPMRMELWWPGGAGAIDP
jgi:hypothetical protein